MTLDAVGVDVISAYLGVSQGSVNYWVKTKPEGFPLPDINARALRARPIARLWFENRIPEIRDWYAGRRKMTPEKAAAHWANIDQMLRADGESRGTRLTKQAATIHPEQTAIEL